MAYVTPAQRYDVLAVGDVATDVIIRLPVDRIHRRVDDRGRWIELPLGEKLAIERDVTVAAGGSAANAAVAFARLGLRVGLASFLAHDHVGFDLLTALHNERIDTHLIHIDAPAQTNRDFVLTLEGERTILVRDGDFNYHWPHLRPSEVPTWLYLTSLGRGALEYQDQIADWLADNPQVHLAFQPGTFQIEAGRAPLARLYKRAEIILCDASQARAITERSTENPAELLRAMADLGGHGHLVISDDLGGGVAWDGTQAYTVPPFPDSSPPFDRTGAADAFSATTTAGIIRGEALPDALRAAAVNFMSVSHELGSQAGLLTDQQMDDQLAELGAAFTTTTSAA